MRAMATETWRVWVRRLKLLDIKHTAQEKAEEMAENAVVARLAPICVEQFKKDSEKDQKLIGLKKEDSWKRNDYVEKQGWATMPGEKKPDSTVAGKCAEMIVQLGQ